MSSTRKPGQLRIYLGAAPGVGKTYAMLREAHRRLELGEDVVAAVVETHGRVQTAEALVGIEVIPPKLIEYRGTVMSEMDIDAVIARRPHTVLVDELAHTNTPGSRNGKRWQDIDELLAAGIEVISTVNIQHLESLNDVVQQITGVIQRETVPDEVVRAAAQIELVDIAPEALQRRISAGNVYAAEKIDAALSNYFRQGNLTALRELALLWLADQVDSALAKYRADKQITATWEARERVVVAVTGGPESETLVRRARRIAAKSSAELLVLHVVRGDGLSGVAAPAMGKVRELATSLGASLHSVVGDDVPKTLLEFARQVNATQVVVGTSRRSRWARVFDEGIGATVTQMSGPIDVHMVTHEEAAKAGMFRRRALLPQRRRLLSWLAAGVVPAAVTAVAETVPRNFLDLSGESALFFIAVLGVALLGGVGPAILSALISGALLNYFFISPSHTLTVEHPGTVLTVVLLMVVAVAVAVLVDNAARTAAQARQASREAELLTLFAGSVLRGADLPALLERARETFSQRAVSLRGGAEGIIAAVGEAPPHTADEADTAVEVGEGDYWLLLAGGKLPARDRRVLNALANQAVGLVRQQHLAEEASTASALAEADHLRRALLSAVSHDLRTPLAGAKAAVSSLRSEDVEFSPDDTAELLATVEESIDQLTVLVGNLLDSSRLAAGVVRPHCQPVFLDEVVNRALISIGPRGAHHGAISRVKVDVGDVSPMADGALLERVLANLIDNALRYGGIGDVRVDAIRSGDRVLMRVVDTGPGIPSEEQATLFEPLQRLGDYDNTNGAGLGLSVVRGFVEAMGGTVAAEDTPGGGLTMVVDLAAAETIGTGTSV